MAFFVERHSIVNPSEDISIMNQMSISQPEDNLNILRKTQPKAKKSEQKVEIEYVAESGWGAIKPSPSRSYVDKPVLDWNRNDLRQYVNQSFFEKTGKPFPSNERIAACYNVLNEVESVLEARLQFPCTTETLKSYIDFFYEKHLMTVISQWRLSYNTFKFDVYINSYVEHVKQEMENIARASPSPVAVVVEKVNDLSLAEFAKHYRISKHVLVKTYGIAVTCQYFMLKRTRDEAKAWVLEAILKLKKMGEITFAIAATKKYTYPEWFDLALVDEILVSAGEPTLSLKTGETDIFEFLRSVK